MRGIHLSAQLYNNNSTEKMSCRILAEVSQTDHLLGNQVKNVAKGVLGAP